MDSLWKSRRMLSQTMLVQLKEHHLGLKPSNKHLWACQCDTCEQKKLQHWLTGWEWLLWHHIDKVSYIIRWVVLVWIQIWMYTIWKEKKWIYSSKERFLNNTYVLFERNFHQLSWIQYNRRIYIQQLSYSRFLGIRNNRNKGFLDNNWRWQSSFIIQWIHTTDKWQISGLMVMERRKPKSIQQL